MIIGIPREIEPDENRVAITPLLKGLNVWQGRLTCRAVAESLGMKYHEVIL
ncbi:MAG TPA: hypothetical protein PLI09_12385 [Candidatus Hydrogenedentes bacterium]|nr:hypothetical protein [Candidatus Hydrogenedentota bacterium]